MTSVNMAQILHTFIRKGCQSEILTRNLSVDKIGERYRSELRQRCKNFTTILLDYSVTLAYFIGESRLFQRTVTFFWLLRLINTLNYLLTYLLISFLLISMAVLWNNLQTRWYENFYHKAYNTRTQLKAYDKYVEYWRDLEMWVRWSFKVIENGADQ